MTKEQIISRFKEKPYMLDMGAGRLAKWLETTRDVIIECKKIVNSNIDNFGTTYNPKDVSFKKVEKANNILIIGDTHLPYEKEGYLEFCKEQYDKYNCDTVIHIGDLIDSHATSRHPTIPDAYSAGDELSYTIEKLKKWYSVFPNVKVCIGNHDAVSNRIASEYQIASKWLKDYKDVLEVPNWEFKEIFEINNTIYLHGTGTTGALAAYTRSLNMGKNIVMGHLHTESSIMYHKSSGIPLFGMIIGSGVDESSYGMNYAKNFVKRTITSCGIILGDQPILKIMK